MISEPDRTRHITDGSEMVESVFERMRTTGTFSVMHDERTWRIAFEPHPAAGLPRTMYLAEARWLWNTAAEIDRQIVADRSRWPVRINPESELDPRFE